MAVTRLEYPSHSQWSTSMSCAPFWSSRLVEYRRSERLEQDILTLRQVLYATSLTECMPTALAEGGPGYGTGIQASEMQRLAKLAGFRECAGMLPDDPLRSFFVLRK